MEAAGRRSGRAPRGLGLVFKPLRSNIADNRSGQLMMLYQRKLRIISLKVLIDIHIQSLPKKIVFTVKLFFGIRRTSKSTFEEISTV